MLKRQSRCHDSKDKESNRTSTLSGVTAQKLKFSVKDFFSKCDQIRSFLRIWSLLLSFFVQ